MNRESFKLLKIGDMCIIKRGHDKGKQCEILWKEDETILFRWRF